MATIVDGFEILVQRERVADLADLLRDRSKGLALGAIRNTFYERRSGNSLQPVRAGMLEAFCSNVAQGVRMLNAALVQVGGANPFVVEAVINSYGLESPEQLLKLWASPSEAWKWVLKGDESAKTTSDLRDVEIFLHRLLLVLDRPGVLASLFGLEAALEAVEAEEPATQALVALLLQEEVCAPVEVVLEVSREVSDLRSGLSAWEDDVRAAQEVMVCMTAELFPVREVLVEKRQEGPSAFFVAELLPDTLEVAFRALTAAEVAIPGGTPEYLGAALKRYALEMSQSGVFPGVVALADIAELGLDWHGAVISTTLWEQWTKS